MHLCKKGLSNLLAVGDTTYAYFAFFGGVLRFSVLKTTTQPPNHQTKPPY